MKFHNAKLIPGPVSVETYLRQEPGVKRGDPAYVMSRSDLMEFSRCPLRWKNGYRQDDTEATDHGSLVDCLLTDRATFGSRYVVEPPEYTNEKGENKKWNNNANVCREWTAEAVKRGQQVVKRQEVEDAESAVAQLMADDAIRELVEDSDFQVMIVAEYHHKETGIMVLVKCLIDGVPRSIECLWDLKTARNGSPGLWPRVVFDRGYDAQAVIELALFNAATGEDRQYFRHVVSENVAPWQVAKHALSDDFLLAGRIRIEAALVQYAKCVKSGVWPGYTSVAMTAEGWHQTMPLPWMQPNPEAIYGELPNLPPFVESEMPS